MSDNVSDNFLKDENLRLETYCRVQMWKDAHPNDSLRVLYENELNVLRAKGVPEEDIYLLHVMFGIYMVDAVKALSDKIFEDIGDEQK